MVLPTVFKSRTPPWSDSRRIRTSCGSSCPTSLPGRCWQGANILLDDELTVVTLNLGFSTNHMRRKSTTCIIVASFASPQAPRPVFTVSPVNSEPVHSSTIILKRTSLPYIWLQIDRTSPPSRLPFRCIATAQLISAYSHRGMTPGYLRGGNVNTAKLLVGTRYLLQQFDNGKFE